jgi:hypothetical protein
MEVIRQKQDNLFIFPLFIKNMNLHDSSTESDNYIKIHPPQYVRTGEDVF